MIQIPEGSRPDFDAAIDSVMEDCVPLSQPTRSQLDEALEALRRAVSAHWQADHLVQLIALHATQAGMAAGPFLQAMWDRRREESPRNG